jgi:hypothetical protein
LISSTANAVNCTTGLLSTNGTNVTLGEVENAIRCLQSEVDSVKLEDNQPSTNEEKTWVIQVAATTDKSYADEVRDTFKSLGYKTEIITSLNTDTEKKKNWYKVHVGEYTWRSEALQYKDIIRDTYVRYKDCFVTSSVKN